MNANLKMLVQFLITTEIIALLLWLVHLVVATPDLSASARDVINTVLFQIVPLVTGLVGFWVGTSISSASKDQTISTLTKGAP